jgi:hypothetical protein
MRSSPPPPTERFYAIDRVEEHVAILIDDAGRSASVPVSRLPPGTAEGVVLRIPFEANVPNWSRAMIDPTETQRRRDSAGQLVEELEERDPGGDVEL